MPNLPEFKAGKAEVCKAHTDGRTDYLVRLPDGVVISCGSDYDGQARAAFVCEAINVVMKWADIYPPLGSLDAHVMMGIEMEGRNQQDAIRRMMGSA